MHFGFATEGLELVLAQGRHNIYYRPCILAIWFPSSASSAVVKTIFCLRGRLVTLFFLLPDQAFGSFLRLSVSTCLCDCGLGLFPGKLSQRHLREPRCWSCSQAFASTKRIPGQVSLPTQVHKWWVVDSVGFEEQEAGPPLSFMQNMLMHSNYSVATIPFQ